MARGYCYEITTDEDAVLSMSENDLYDYASHEFDYAANLSGEESKELTKGLTKRFSEVEKRSVGGKKYFAFKISEGDKIKFFKNKFEDFKKQTEKLTLTKFATDENASYYLRMLLADTFSDAVYLDGNFYDLDTFVRVANENETYYIGNVCLMH